MVRQVISAFLILLVGLAAYCAVGPRGGASASAAPTPSTRPNGIAVVELFTSQGCSSCPPAGKVLADLRQAAERDGRAVFTLAFHVDYWNRLGWADPFSDAAYSRRQEGYAKALYLDSIYTPQMIVNGQKQFVGSRREAADRAIAEALAARPTVQVSVELHGTAREGFKVHTTLTGGDASTVVNVAIVEQGLSTDVKKGENGGSHLEEPSVVRWFKSVAAADAGSVAVPSLSGVRADRASVIVYAQRPEHGAIVGAAAAALP